MIFWVFKSVIVMIFVTISMTAQAVPIPDIPHDSSLTFELIMFAYVAAALGLQYLNLYR